MMKTELKTITPTEAFNIIEEQDKKVMRGESKQRKVNQALVDQFTADMTAGNWRVTHQGIAFNSAGILIDGQHRLRAVIKANKTQKFLVTYDIDTIEVIDTGLMRPLAQQLALVQNYSNSNEHTAIIKGLCLFLTNAKYYRISPNQAIAIYDKTKLYNLTLELFKIIPHTTYRRQTFAVPWILYSLQHPQKARDFAIKYYNLENCEKGAPPLVLNRYFANTKLRPRVSQLHLMQVTAQALFYFNENQTIAQASLRGSRESQRWLLEGNQKLCKHILTILNLPNKF